MSTRPGTGLREILLTRRGVVLVESTGDSVCDDHLRAFEIELGDLGYVLSSRLRKRLSTASLDELVTLRKWIFGALLAHVGGDQKHEPLFRRFPDGIPPDTLDLWWSKVLLHFLQAPDQPCLFCGRIGTTHVLAPCEHVVCDHCFDGSSHSACPVCEHHVDRSSPFFESPPHRNGSFERITFKRLDLGEDERSEAGALFSSFCDRKQALSPMDRDALVAIVTHYRKDVLNWLPPAIPVRENVALVFGNLFQLCSPDDVLPLARRFTTTATDVLRFIAVLSGTDGSLQRESVVRPARIPAPQRGQLEHRSVAPLGVLASSLRGGTRRPALAE